MSKYIDLEISEIHELLKEGKVTPTMLVEECFSRIAKNDYNAFITLDRNSALSQASALEEKGFIDNLLWGIPIAIKDNIMVKDLRCTCASRMLDNFVSIYDAKVIEDIKKQGMIIIGKTNMDEFAMGSTSETSFYGAPINPWNKNRVCGGSSGGSAVAVASRLVPLALGSDTGGSVRQPASFNGIVGMKPTYGRISRYGLVAFASSFDQIGPMTKNVYENALLLNAICNQDDRDLTTFKTSEDFTRLIGQDVSNLKIAIPNYFMGDDVSEEIRNKVLEIKKMLEEKGCQIDFVDINHIDKASLLYQIISYGEASSNLARFDGVRYGYRFDSDNLEEMYTKTRQLGFGKEVKRRIMVGSYILSGENAQIYYTKALQIRDDLKKSFKNIFKNYDLIIGPTTARCAYEINNNNDNPLQSFLDDILVMHANLGGFPGMSIPIGFNSEHLPIGMQILGDTCEESKMYQLASFIEKELNLDLGGANIENL